ncbi:MAG: GIN domain-containing protein [Asticcacaulis sp.]
MKKLVLMAGIAALSLSAAAFAQAASAATEVELRHTAARVNVIPENRPDVALTVNYGNSRLPKIMVHNEGDKLVADGKLDMRSISCHDDGLSVTGYGQIAGADLPVITIHVPMDAKVAVGGGAYGQIGATKALEFSEGGCGSWKIADVAGKGEINIGGSGNITAGSLAEAEVNIGGSGNFKAQTLGRLEGNIGGHGDINADTLNGDGEVNIGGSGNVNLGGGHAPRMEVNIAGSGRVMFGGEVGNLEVNIVGSGDVHIKKVTGNVSKSVMGSGNIVIGQ